MERNKQIRKWEIHEILDKKKVNGKVRYLVKWRRFSSLNSWEPTENFVDRELIVQYDKKLEEIRRRTMTMFEKNEDQVIETSIHGVIGTEMRSIIDEELLCGICHELYKEVTIIECNHIFCYKCISHWKTLNSTCPICRRPFLKLNKIVQLNNFFSKISQHYCTKNNLNYLKKKY